MSTRSNTLIKNIDTGDKICLYRHCDGYLSGAGFDLLDFALKIKNLGIGNIYQIAQKLKDAHLGYEDSKEGLHGDIEYLYELNVSKGKISGILASEVDVVNEYTGEYKGTDVTAQLIEEYEADGNAWNLQDTNDKVTTDNGFIELTNAGALKLEKISIKKSSIVSVAKTENGKFGCIVQVMGEKYPVAEKYEDVLKMI